MNSEEKFKGILKEKLEGKEFPFNAENWEKAKDMIDASRAKKRRFFPFLFLCLGIFISGGLFFYILDNTVLDSESKLATTDAHPKFGEALPANDLKTTVESGTVQRLPAQQLNEHKEQQQVNVERAVAESAEPIQANEAKNTHAGTRPEKQNLAGAPLISEQSRLAAGKKRRQKEKNSNAEIPQVKNNSSMALNMGRHENKHAAPEKAKDPAVTSKSDMQPEDSVQANDVKPSGIDTKLLAVDLTTAETPHAPVETVSVAPAADAIVSEEKPDPATTAPADSTLAKIEKDPKNIFSVEGGLNYHLGWNSDGERDGNGVNPLIGINYQRVVTDKISISLGVHYTTVGNLGNFSHTSTDKRYGFGSTSEMTVITPVKMHYLIAPLRLQYDLDKKNSVGAGYTFGYLLTVNSKVENYTQRLNATSDREVTKTKGYSEGFNAFDSQASVFYRRRIISELSAQAEFFFGMTDVRDNTFFASKAFERNMGIKFTLIYNIFKR